MNIHLQMEKIRKYQVFKDFSTCLYFNELYLWMCNVLVSVKDKSVINNKPHYFHCFDIRSSIKKTFQHEHSSALF